MSEEKIRLTCLIKFRSDRTNNQRIRHKFLIFEKKFKSLPASAVHTQSNISGVEKTLGIIIELKIAGERFNLLELT